MLIGGKDRICPKKTNGRATLLLDANCCRNRRDGTDDDKTNLARFRIIVTAIIIIVTLIMNAYVLMLMLMIVRQQIGTADANE